MTRCSASGGAYGAIDGAVHICVEKVRNGDDQAGRISLVGGGLSGDETGLMRLLSCFRLH